MSITIKREAPHYCVKIFGTRNCHVYEMSETINYYYYCYVIRTLGTTTDKIDRRTDKHTENKHKTTH